MNIRILILWIFLPLVAIKTAACQTAKLSGRVLDSETYKPIPWVVVILQESGDSTSRVIQYTSANLEGAYRIDCASLKPEYTLHYSILGYESKMVRVDPNGNGVVNVFLKQKPFQMKDVLVTPPKIELRRDTISYNVSSFADIQDRSIADVLKKMPGIVVDANGRIKYNNEPINKFYIEGVDLLEGKYGLATNNISQKDVARVEVLENHQPIKALTDLAYSDQAAINIKLKESAKAKWTGSANLQAGATPFLWDANLFAMRIAPKTQSMNTYKTNNVGKKIADELNDFSLTDFVWGAQKEYAPEDYITVSAAKLSELQESRSLFNRTHLLSSANMWKLSDDYQLKGNVTYLNDDRVSDRYAKTEYFLSDKTLTTIDDTHANQNRNSLQANVVLFANTEKVYLKNSLKANLLWDRVNTLSMGTYSNEQQAYKPSHQLSNDFRFIKRINNHSLTISSYNQYLCQPQSLSVEREEGTQSQELYLSAFYSNSSVAYTFQKKRWVFALNGGIKAFTRLLKNSLSGLNQGQDQYETESRIHYINAYFLPQIEYKSAYFRATLNLPISDYYYWYEDRINSVKNSSNSFLINPRLYLNWQVSSKINLIASGSLGKSEMNIDNFYHGIIMRNYRYLSEGVDLYDNNFGKSVSLGFTYKDPLNTLHINLNATRLWTTLHLVSQQDFMGDYVVNSFDRLPNNRAVWMLKGSVSKGIESIHGKVSLEINYSSSKMAMFQEGIFMPYRSNTITISPDLTTRFARWGNLNYKLTFAQNSLVMEQNSSKTYQLRQALELTVSPIKKLRFSLLGEYYYNQINPTTSKHTFLMDLSSTYSFDKFEINFSITNLLNNQEYAYTTYNALSSYSFLYKIRPRSFIIGVLFKF